MILIIKLSLFPNFSKLWFDILTKLFEGGFNRKQSVVIFWYLLKLLLIALPLLLLRCFPSPFLLDLLVLLIENFRLRLQSIVFVFDLPFLHAEGILGQNFDLVFHCIDKIENCFRLNNPELRWIKK
jgi:hypothetical protein